MDPLEEVVSVCDAPPYAVVQACAAVGVERPEDSAWTNLAKGERAECCGKNASLPRYRFTYSNGDEVTYGVNQCSRCGRVFWSEG